MVENGMGEVILTAEDGLLTMLGGIAKDLEGTDEFGMGVAGKDGFGKGCAARGEVGKVFAAIGDTGWELISGKDVAGNAVAG